EGRAADSPQRVVMDANLLVSPAAKILPAWIVTAKEGKEPQKAEWLKKNGSELLIVSTANGRLSLPETLELPAGQGVTRLVGEAGSAISGAFMAQGLVDRLYWFRAPALIGEKGMAALDGHDIMRFPERPDFALKATERFGEDVLEIYDSITNP